MQTLATLRELIAALVTALETIPGAAESKEIDVAKDTFLYFNDLLSNEAELQDSRKARSLLRSVVGYCGSLVDNGWDQAVEPRTRALEPLLERIMILSGTEAVDLA